MKFCGLDIGCLKVRTSFVLCVASVAELSRSNVFMLPLIDSDVLEGARLIQALNSGLTVRCFHTYTTPVSRAYNELDHKQFLWIRPIAVRASSICSVCTPMLLSLIDDHVIE